MHAIDTNVLVRFLTGDDPKQAKIARKAFEAGEIHIPVTVMIETEWVLRAGYGISRDMIATGLRAVGGLPNVNLDRPQAVATALDWFEGGMDFGDALHLALSAQCQSFITFDRKLAKLAKARSAIPVVLP